MRTFPDIVTRVLSSKFFVHINKLTYGIYLLNPLIIIVTFGVSDSSVHADPIPAVSYFNLHLCLLPSTV